MHPPTLDGLLEITLADKPLFDQIFGRCQTPLSDYSFANTFIWRDAIHLRWRIAHDCLCVYANGDGGLTLLFPPLGAGDFRRALAESIEICETYNSRARYQLPMRVEYVSAELLPQFPSTFRAHSMSGDYVYETSSMIHLEGGALASKRKSRNRFARSYVVRTTPLRASDVPGCIDLLKTWHAQTDPGEPNSADPTVQLKRAKEESAALDALTHASALGLTGMVLYAGDQLAGFTLGEMLRPDTCSIVIEKTDRQFKGAAQFIFSEFCRQYWSHTRWCNVGDDWDVPALAWTKQSYRPASRALKWVLHPSTPELIPPVPEPPADLAHGVVLKAA